MTANKLISDIIPTIKTSDSGQKALNWMEIFRISHLPIVNNHEFLGLISDADIYDLNMADEPIGNHQLSLMKPYVFGKQHIYEVIEVISRLKLTLVPVLDDDKQYIGSITLHDLLHHFATLTAVQNEGGIIVLEMNYSNYSLTQIAQIIESNDAKILSIYLNSIPNSSRIEVTIKTNRMDVTSIVQTFIRFDYQIKGTYLEQNQMDTLIENRMEALLNYLNM